MNSSQMLKGILEGCLLAVIAKGETYGYEMIEKLQTYGFSMVKEGSIYPLLLRMRKGKLVEVKEKSLPSGGPPRKYYTITKRGLEELEVFKKNWADVSNAVDNVLKN
ncbi:PadR family transcriptional regulator [Fervidibacillus halotolerans]|uniref:PadR family transcriptional regulator n=1 Tax=Fervidibacillus halotolerans TaxID=2980027 RepID=A0A9E8M0U8_9BACI|nr:PadR family transcriptional regulator [Fervidibacillus halotolerans]WAA13144.1 PadR family transcriptional regulator [Fervidibacillus halotolerans]